MKRADSHRDAGRDIERLVAAEDWEKARRRIRAELRREREDHWLLSRLALTYYEQYRYSTALNLEARALSIAPRCPMVLWGYAGSLQMLRRFDEATSIYRRLIRRGDDRLAFGPCGEGLRWARGLVADCWYRLGQIAEHQGARRRAQHAYERHLAQRRNGRSIYSREEVVQRLAALATKPARRRGGR